MVMEIELSRNGSGTYTKVNTFVAGNSITAAGHNSNWDDIATEMTNSVAADGQTTMTGPLKAASGTVGAPGVAFASDTDCGLYRIGANNIGVAVNGAKVLDVATTGLAVTGTLSSTGAFASTGVISQGGFALLPAGVIFPYGGTSAPSGYLLCYGQSLLRADYADLFTAIGTTYGAADGTHFSLPDLRGRVVAGQDDMGGSSANRLTGVSGSVDGDTLGGAGGTETHTLTTAELASHTHVNTLNDPGHFHAIKGGSGTGGGVAIINGSAGSFSPDDVTGSKTTGVTITNASAGSGSAHNNVQPTFLLNYIIFAGI
jgi:microcystin-dependent protein